MCDVECRVGGWQGYLAAESRFESLMLRVSFLGES